MKKGTVFFTTPILAAITKNKLTRCFILSFSMLFIALSSNALDFYWTNGGGDNDWDNPANWNTVPLTPGIYPNHINKHYVYFNSGSANCNTPTTLIQVAKLHLGSLYDGTITIQDAFIIKELLKVENSSSKIIAPSSQYVGVRGDISLKTGANFDHNAGKFIFYGGQHTIDVDYGNTDPWILNDVQVTKGAASGPYASFILNTGEVEIHGTTTLAGHLSTGIFFKSGLFKLKGNCIINNLTSSVTKQDGGLLFCGNGNQTIQNIGASSAYPATIAGAIGRIEIDKPNGSMTMIGAISIMRELKLKSAVDASNATLILNMVSGGTYPDPTYSCRLNLDVPLTVPHLAINPAQNSGLKVIGDLTITSTLETRGKRRINFQEGKINLEGTLHHNNYFAYSTSGDLMGNGLIRFSGSSTQTMTRNPISLREFKGMLPNIEIDNPNGVEVRGMHVVDGNINFLMGHFIYPTIDDNQHILALKQHGTVSNTNDNSYVKGPFRKFGEVSASASFDFPVGEEDGSDKYRPIRISNLDLPNSNNPRAYTALTARYFLQDPNILSAEIAPSIGSITDCEYWQLDEYYAPWASISPYPFTCNVALSWYNTLNDNCDNDFYEFSSHVAGLEHTGASTDSWQNEGNSGFINTGDYSIINSNGTAITFNPVNPNYFTIGSDLAPCGPNKFWICHNDLNLCLPASAIATHLAHGDYLGLCGALKSIPNINAGKNLNEIQIFPNPNNGQFSITIDDFKGYGKIEIYNSMGKIIVSKEITIENQVIDLKKENNGIYLVKITNGTKKNIKRIIKN